MWSFVGGSVNQFLVETCASKLVGCSDQEITIWVSIDTSSRTLHSMVAILVDDSEMVPK